MSTELAFKKEITALLDNPMITSLIRDKVYNIDNSTQIVLDGKLNFSLSMVNDRLVLDILDVKPQIVAKRLFMKMKGRISKISIGKNDIVVAIDGLPDQTITLT